MSTFMDRYGLHGQNGLYGLTIPSMKSILSILEIIERIMNERKDIEMKKIMAVFFVMTVLFPMTANATYRLKLF